MSYSSYQSQPAHPVQLPPCVPMNPNTKQRPARKKTEREMLQARARQISISAAIEAMSSHPFYDVLAYDYIENIVTLRQAMYPQNEPYIVDLRNLTCTCPHFKGAVSKVNHQLAEAGLPASLLCKHFSIISEKEAVNPRVLDDAPDAWEWKRAESLEDTEEECEREAQENAYWEGTL